MEQTALSLLYAHVISLVCQTQACNVCSSMIKGGSLIIKKTFTSVQSLIIDSMVHYQTNLLTITLIFSLAITNTICKSQIKISTSMSTSNTKEVTSYSVYTTKNLTKQGSAHVTKVLYKYAEARNTWNPNQIS